MAHAGFLEQHVPQWLWKAFVATCPEDRDLLVHHLKDMGVAVVMDASPPEQLGPPPNALAVTEQVGRAEELADNGQSPMTSGAGDEEGRCRAMQLCGP